jgi:hypothetical protein
MHPTEGAVVEVDTHDLWATQATIEPFITCPAADAQQQRTALTDVLQQLQQGTLHPRDLPPIRVVQHADRYYSLDNRRLWLFHQLPRPCVVPVMLVDKTKEFFQKLTNTAGARSPKLRSTFAAAATAAGAGLNAIAPVSRYMYEGRLEQLVLKWSEVNITNRNYFNAEQVSLLLSFPAGQIASLTV